MTKKLSYILYNFSIPLKIRGVLKEEAILPQHFHNNLLVEDYIRHQPSYISHNYM